MMDQYRRAKSLHKDAVLFFRLGDFYEMFFEDAIEVSALLNLTLTHRQGEPMCGVPYHAARSYIARLLKLGKKIAICEQLTEPGKGKGLVERDVVEVITPGTALEEDFLDQASNNYLVALCSSGNGASGAIPETLSIAYMDISTAEFRAFSFLSADPVAAEERLRKELYRLSPRELIVQQSLLERPEISGCLEERPSLILNRLPDWSFDFSGAAEELKSRFGLATLKGLGFGDSAPELAAAGALLRYVDEAAAARAVHLRPPLPYEAADYAQVDESSQKNLEIVQNLHDSTKAYSLLETLDYTKTAAGARLLRQWLLEPLRLKASIEARLDSVDFLYRDQRLLSSLREALSRVLDAERLASRVAMDKAHAKDLLALRDSLEACASVRSLLKAAIEGDGCAAKKNAGLLAGGPSPAEEAVATEAAAMIGEAIKEEPSILLTEGNIIRSGYDEELDRLHGLKENSRAVLESYLEEEKTASGISNLRVRYNKIIGYYLEVSKGRLESVPSHFIRRQSLVNGERYTTPRLSELESEMNGATERIVELERRLFIELRERVKKSVPAILVVARSAAVQDCLQSFAWAATVRGYSRPSLYEDGRLHIVEGRHPVVEAHLPSGSFVPNGLDLCASDQSSDAPGLASEAGASGAGRESEQAAAGAGRESEQAAAGAGRESFALITGPNMAGKSTFLRQTALIVLMAQVGSFVPALEADIGIVDRIFCRVGAQDNLARGESTFLVEMHETARILNTATDRSLVVMDEVGRGTSTIDGLAIAWAVSEDLLSRLGCRTLFATHYHELTALSHPRLKNLSLSVLEEEGEVVFLKRIVAGPALGSYGIHVARLAGLPPWVLGRAQSVEEELSRKEKLLPLPEMAAVAPEAGTQGKPAKGGSGRSKEEDLFSPADMVLSELASLNIDKLSPLEALNRLAALKKELQSG
jgi:DNA mismatch repair protein MutS